MDGTLCGPTPTESKTSVETLEEGDVPAHSNHDGDMTKTLYDADVFLVSFSALREENDRLKQNNVALEMQLEKARQELQEMSLAKDALQAQLLRDWEQNKELLWKLRSDYQKVQEERLQWKEKYLELCAQASTVPTGLPPSQSGVPDKTGSFYTSLSTAFGLAGQMPHPQPLAPATNQLFDLDKKRFECKECKATFRIFSDLQAHIDKKKCVKYTFQCPQCSVVFSNAGTFTKHLKHHLGKSMLCEFCGDKFMHEKGLKRHVKMYHTELAQTYQCQYCPKVFGRKSLLENHVRRHFDYRPYKCHHCEKSFKTRQYLTGHINGVHKSDKQFVCEKCHARFSWRTTWKRHVQNHLAKESKKRQKKRAALVAAAGGGVGGGIGSAVTSLTTVVTNMVDLQQQLSHNGLQITQTATLGSESGVGSLGGQDGLQLEHSQLNMGEMSHGVHTTHN